MAGKRKRVARIMGRAVKHGGLRETGEKDQEYTSGNGTNDGYQASAGFGGCFGAGLCLGQYSHFIISLSCHPRQA